MNVALSFVSLCQDKETAGGKLKEFNLAYWADSIWMKLILVDN